MAKTAQAKQYKLKKNRNLSSVVKRSIPGWLIILPSLALFVFIVWRPIAIGIRYSFFSLRGFEPVEFVGLKNFKDVLTDTNFIQTLQNTLQYVLWSMIIGFPLPFVCAVMMNEMVHMKGYFKITTYLPVVVPAIATSLIWKMVYMDGPGGLLNMVLYYFGVEPMQWLSNKNIAILLIIISTTWNGFGGTLILYLGALQGVNQELYEAARLDGAGFFGRICHVMIPHMRGMLLLMAIRQIIGIFNITEQPLAMTGGGPSGASMSLGLTNYFYAFKYGQYEKSLALGVIVFCILAILTYVYFKLDKRVNE